MYESLSRINSSYYRDKYPRLRDTSFTEVTVEEYRMVLATGEAVLFLHALVLACQMQHLLLLVSTPPTSYPSPATLPPLSLSPVPFGMLTPFLTSSSLYMTSFSLTLCSYLL
ncbi:hypothetical protein FKM82_016697 [Ascaphus truei]